MEEAFFNVPREEFVLPDDRGRAYIDSPQCILAGQTISAIHMVLIYISPSCTNPQIGDTVLEIGAGSGYNAAMYAEMVAPKGVDNPGHVYAVEIIPKLVDFAKRNIERTGYSEHVTIIASDGGEGYKPKAPYNIISVAAAAKKVPPPLISQLAKGGRLVIPVGSRIFQEMVLIVKDETGKYTEEKSGGVRFVPLTGKYG